MLTYRPDDSQTKMQPARTSNGSNHMKARAKTRPPMRGRRATATAIGGASVWGVKASGKLLARLYAEDGYQLRQRLVPLVGLLNGKAGLPKLWSL